MGQKKIGRYTLCILILLFASTKAYNSRAESTQRPVYIFKELAGTGYPQKNIRFSLKSKNQFTISLNTGTVSGNNLWINFPAQEGSASYKSGEPIEIPIGREFIDNEWQIIEILNLDDLIAPSGESYHHLKKIGIIGTSFQLGMIEMFSGTMDDPSDLEIISCFDNSNLKDIFQYGWYSNDSQANITLVYNQNEGYLQVEGQTISSTTSGSSSSTSNKSSNTFNYSSSGYGNQGGFFSPYAASGYSPYPAFYPSQSMSGFYQPYFPPPPNIPPLFGYGYQPGLPPFGFGPQPLLSILQLTGLPSYFNSPNPGYPYSVGGNNFSTLFAGGTSSYPFSSPFPEQTYNYLTPITSQSPPSYTIYTSPLTSTLAPSPTTLAIISGIIPGGGGGGGLGGPGFAGGPII